jgi:hypothetical protein
MNHATVEDSNTSFPYPILPTVYWELDYHTIHAIHKLLQANARTINTHLGGGAMIQLVIIVSDAAYPVVSPSTPWENPASPGRGPTSIEGWGKAAQISAAKHQR